MDPKAFEKFAFPSVMPPDSHDGQCVPFGMTKREYFALHLMCALKSQVDPETGNDAYAHHGAADAAVTCADELLKRLAHG